MTASAKYRKKPNFPLIVALAAVAMLLIFIGAYLVVRERGVRLLPKLQHDPHPTSMILPMPSARTDV